MRKTTREMICRACLTSSAAVPVWAGGSLPVATPPERPNVVMIFTDDQGWGDVGLLGYHEDTLTPNLDQLARDGVLFTDGYITAPQCAPSRAALMTGRYQQRFGMEHIAMGPLPLDEVTLPDRLGALGYRCGMVGKWHLEPNNATRGWAAQHAEGYDPSARVWIRWEHTEGYRPEDRGFHDVFFGEYNHGWANYDLEGNTVDPMRRIQGPDCRIDSQTEAGLAFIRRQSEEQPFFLYLAYYAPHVPLAAKEEDLALFEGVEPVRRRYGLAMIHAMDRGLGRIRELLEEQGMADNTLIIYMADNGAPLLSHVDNRHTIEGNGWTGSHNAPLTGEKGTLAEGGIRVPFIAAMPGKIPSGQRISEPVMAFDWVPTLLASAGVEQMPAAFDGSDLWPLMLEGTSPERALFWRFWGQSAVRQGPWKLLVVGPHQWLFNMEQDKEETNDLSAAYPERVQRLRAMIEEWERDNDPVRPVVGRVLNDQEQRWFAEHFPALFK